MKNCMRLSALLILTTALSLPLAADAASVKNTQATLVTQIGGATRDVRVQGTYAYVAEGDSLLILNIANPARPLQEGRLPLPATPQRVEVSGKVAFVLYYDHAQLVDVSKPSAPRLAGVVPAYNNPPWYGPICAANKGTLLYVDNGNGVQVVDCGNPDRPVVRGNPGINNNRGDLAIADNRLYVRGTDVTIYDISNPFHAKFLGAGDAPPTSKSFGQMTAVGSVVYFAPSGGGFYCLDATNPMKPQLTRIVLSGPGTRYNGPIGAMAGSGKTLYLLTEGMNEAAVEILDISDPAHPTITGGCRLPGQSFDYWAPMSIALGNGQVWTALGFGGLAAVDVHKPTASRQIADWMTPKFPCDIVTSGSLALILDTIELEGAASVAISLLDISRPGKPAYQGVYRPKQETGYSLVTGYQIALAGRRAYFACSYSGVEILDISNPTSPTLRGAYSAGSPVRGVAARGNLVYVSAANNFQIVDATDPAQPVLLGQCKAACYGKVFLWGNLACINVNEVIDISDPHAPKRIPDGKHPTLTGVSSFAAGDGLLVASGDQGLSVFDLAQSDYARPAATLPILHASSISIQRGLVAAVSANKTLYTINALDPASSVQMSTMTLPIPYNYRYGSSRISVNLMRDGYWYAGSDGAGLCVFTRPISVLSPTGAATLRSGSRIDVRWRTNLSQAGSVVWLELWNAKGYVASLSYDWNPAGEATKSVCLPLVPEGSDYRIRAISYWDPTLYAESELPFTISGGAVRLDSPERATWMLNTRQAIAWQSNPKISGTAVRFELWRGGKKVKDLGYGWNPAGRATTLVPVTGVPAANDYRLRVVSTWNPQWWDESAGAIRIQSGR